jgi:cellobiose phosphorylase
VGLQLVDAARALLEMIAHNRNRYGQHRRYLTNAAEHTAEMINRHAWFNNGRGEGWYARGTGRDGRFFGTPRDREGAIFLLPQAWALLANLVPPDRIRPLLAAVQKRLFRKECGLLLLAPPYRSTPPLGSFNVYPPGSRENGGVFCHAHAMAVAGLARAADGDSLYACYRSILPPEAGATRWPDGYRILPYAYSQFRYGPDHPLCGRAYGSWLTGAAAWSFYGATQWLLGIRPEYAGLLVSPCIPSRWPGFTVVRRFRGAVYEIGVSNPRGVTNGVASATLDGEPLPSNVLPALGDGRVHRVKIVMG